MTRAERLKLLKDNLSQALAGKASLSFATADEVAVQVELEHLTAVLTQLRDDEHFLFDTLIDVCGVDYLTYGKDEWSTRNVTSSGFTRGADRHAVVAESNDERFEVVYHLLSVEKNQRVRVKVRIADGDPPIVPSVIGIWAAANWFEREAFDLYGILFEGHPDLRRILTDYGFVGHPFRKDFPLEGHVEVRYDASKGRVAYEPVSIEARTLVPRVIRNDNRYNLNPVEVVEGEENVGGGK